MFSNSMRQFDHDGFDRNKSIKCKEKKGKNVQCKTMVTGQRLRSTGGLVDEASRAKSSPAAYPQMEVFCSARPTFWLPHHLHFYGFALKTENHAPIGSVNLSKVNSVTLKFLKWTYFARLFYWTTTTLWQTMTWWHWGTQNWLAFERDMLTKDPAFNCVNVWVCLSLSAHDYNLSVTLFQNDSNFHLRFTALAYHGLQANLASMADTNPASELRNRQSLVINACAVKWKDGI